MKQLKRQAFRFILVGIGSTVINYSGFFVLLKIGINYLLSASAGFIFGVLAGFIFNKSWTFESKKSLERSFIRYFFVYLFSLMVNVIMLKLLVDLGNSPIYSNALLIPIIVALNFLGSKLIAFEDKKW